MGGTLPVRQRPLLRGIAAAAVVLLALALASAAIRWHTGDTTSSEKYAKEPLFGVWGGLLLVQMGVLAVGGLASYTWWKELRNLPAPPKSQSSSEAWRNGALAALVLAVALLAPAAAMPDSYPRNYPDYQIWRVAILGTFAVAAMAAAAAALVRLRTVARELPTDPSKAAERFRFVWGRQRQLLGVLAAMLAINVLATAVKYQMNNHFVAPKGFERDNLPDLPTAYVLVVGAVYGAVILAVYLPVYFATRQVGDELAGKFAGIDDVEDAEGWLAANKVREDYRSALGVSEGTREHLERAAGILAPLITALFAAVLPQIKL